MVPPYQYALQNFLIPKKFCITEWVSLISIQTKSKAEIPTITQSQMVININKNKNVIFLQITQKTK
jgi:hypothetical protein